MIKRMNYSSFLQSEKSDQILTMNLNTTYFFLAAHGGIEKTIDKCL